MTLGTKMTDEQELKLLLNSLKNKADSDFIIEIANKIEIVVNRVLFKIKRMSEDAEDAEQAEEARRQSVFGILPQT
jgi:hypothetical protein